MLLLGFAGLGFMGYRRRRTALAQGRQHLDANGPPSGDFVLKRR
jgi:hypothetical protein